MGIGCASPGLPAGHIQGRLKNRNRLQPKSTYHCLTDHNKNITGLTDSQGNFTATWDYDVFGNIIHQTGSTANRNPLRFSSEYHDEDLGLIYYNYRHYNPKEGRWISRDPIGEKDGLNLYQSLENSGLNHIDYLGLIQGGMDSLINGTFGENPVPFSKENDIEVNGSSVLSVLLNNLPNVIGTLPNISVTLLWIPHPTGKWDVQAFISGSIQRCRKKDKTMGKQFVGNIGVSTSVSVGVGAGGNQGLKRDPKANNKTKLKKMDKTHQYASNPEKGKAAPSASLGLNNNSCECASKIEGSLNIRIGGRAGAIISQDIYADATFNFKDPISFSYGIDSGLSGYIGAEIYLQATGSFDGKYEIG